MSGRIVIARLRKELPIGNIQLLGGERAATPNLNLAMKQRILAFVITRFGGEGLWEAPPQPDTPAFVKPVRVPSLDHIEPLAQIQWLAE